MRNKQDVTIILAKFLKKGFDYESKLEELIFEMCVDNEDEECS